MKKLRQTRPTFKELLTLDKMSRGHASELANGKSLPSLPLAFKIEDALGVSVQVWRP